jgi:hypothetical protein
VPVITSIEHQLNGPIAFGTIRAMPEAPIARKESVDRYVGDYLRKAEVALYHIVALLLAITALATIASAAGNFPGALGVS